MNQTYSTLEILVRDNNSSDNTVGVLERLAGGDPRLRIYKGDENLGAYGGLNYLLVRAVGKYIAINDHDDLWHKDKIRQQVAFLESNSGYVGCGTAIINYYEKHDTFLLRRRPKVSRIAWHTSLIFRNSCLYYPLNGKVANDFHFMKHVLCKEGGRIYNYREPWVLRTIRADHSNLSTTWVSARNLSEILKARVNLVDKAALLNRLLLPERFTDCLIFRLLLRRNVLSRADVEALFK